MAKGLNSRRGRRRLIAYAAGGAFVAGTAIAAVGPGAPWVVDSFGDGARVWRLGRIEIDGVTGGWLGALRARRITIADDEGIWLEARDVALDWRPQDVFFGSVRVNAARANVITVLRQPNLLQRRPSSGTDFDVHIGGVHVETIILDAPVLGEAAQFTAHFAIDLTDLELRGLNVAIRRTDSDADHLIALYRPGEDYALNVDIEGAPNGIIARALGLPDQSVRATAQGDGDLSAGGAQFNAMIGDAELFSGTTSWTGAEWTVAAQGRLDLLPSLKLIAHRIGASVAVSATGAADRRFTAHGETPFLALDLAGALTEEHELDGPARFVATTDRLSAIAREAPFELGAARLEGELRRARGTTAIRAAFDASEIDAFGRRARFTGPLSAALSPERFELAADLRTPDRSAPLFANTRLLTQMEYDRARRRFSLDRAEITGDAISGDAQGWVSGGDGEFAGQWRVRRLEALVDGLRGEAGGRYRAFAEGANDVRVWTTTVDGQGARISGEPEVVPQLLGASPRLDARITYEDGGLTVSHARIEGAQVRAGATGRIVRGQANLAVEATARGPLTIGGAEIAGAVDATGRLTGRIVRPALSIRANLSSFTAGGVVVEQPVVDFTLAPTVRGYAGHANVQGQTSGQPLTASADIAIARGVVAVGGLDAQLAGLHAEGSATFNSHGVTAELAMTGAIDGLAPGMTGRIFGDLTLAAETLVLDAQLVDARAGELYVRAATFRAQGPLDAIAATFDLRGRLRRAPLAFAGTAALAQGNGASTLRIEGRGTLADVEIFTRAPIEARISEGNVQASLDIAVADGVVRAQWTERRRALFGSAQIEDTPIGPLAAIWGERATGRIDGTITLANAGGGLDGAADVTLDDARLAGRQRGLLDMHIVADLDPSRLSASVDATSTEGLVAHFEADAPVETSATPIRVALARERRGRATWSVRGPAESLWAAARLPDQSLEGQIEGEGELQFGAGYLAGDGDIEIIDGRFEDKLTGVTLVNLDARVAIDRRGVTIENFTAQGPRGGTLTATGGSANPQQGRIAVNVRDMLVADRADARARANADLTLEWEGLRSTLTGDINIIEAEVNISSNPETGIATIDVVEINRPGEENDFGDEEAAPRRTSATTLDVRVRAPGRVFTRGRGVDAEWSLNMRLAGTSSAPLVYGTARAVRGTLALSGQPFEIEDARIEFDGDPLDARIDLTAVRDTADLTARIRLIGTARDPEVTFTSDPPLPEDEILPQVLFGRSVEDLSALEAAQLAASLAALSGRASLDLVDAARAAAGLDRFNVRQDENGGFLVAGGVYLTRDVYLEVARTGLGQAQSRVEWTIRPRLVLITSFLGNGDQSVSLRWRREGD